MSRIGTQYKPLKYTIIAVYGWHVQVVVIKYKEKSPSLVNNEGFSVISGATTSIIQIVVMYSLHCLV